MSETHSQKRWGSQLEFVWFRPRIGVFLYFGEGIEDSLSLRLCGVCKKFVLFGVENVFHPVQDIVNIFNSIGCLLGISLSVVLVVI